MMPESRNYKLQLLGEELNIGGKPQLVRPHSFLMFPLRGVVRLNTSSSSRLHAALQHARSCGGCRQAATTDE